ncbi:MAG: DinB family protein, partial [Chloroflexi bacterium]|nr:DinB family protein [Chloroflexota bacterium]
MPREPMAETLKRLHQVREDLSHVVERLKPEHLPVSAGPEEWHCRRVLEHMANAERRFLSNIVLARASLNATAELGLAELVAEWRRAREDLLRELEQVKPEQFTQRAPGHDRTIQE